MNTEQWSPPKPKPKKETQMDLDMNLAYQSSNSHVPFDCGLTPIPTKNYASEPTP